METEKEAVPLEEMQQTEIDVQQFVMEHAELQPAPGRTSHAVVAGRLDGGRRDGEADRASGSQPTRHAGVGRGRPQQPSDGRRAMARLRNRRRGADLAAAGAGGGTSTAHRRRRV
eukprot:768944-Prymnesium_polylepis.2